MMTSFRMIAILGILMMAYPLLARSSGERSGGYVIIGNEGQMAFLNSWEDSPSVRQVTDRLVRGWGRYTVDPAVLLERGDSSEIFVSACCPGMLSRVRLTDESWSDDSVTARVMPEGMELEETGSLFEDVDVGRFIVIGRARTTGVPSSYSVDGLLNATPVDAERIVSARSEWALSDWRPPLPAPRQESVANTTTIQIDPSWVFRPYARTREASLYVATDAMAMPLVVNEGEPKMGGTMYLWERNGEQRAMFLLTRGDSYLVRNGIIYIGGDQRDDMAVYSRDGLLLMQKVNEGPVDILGHDEEWVFLAKNEEVVSRMRITPHGIETDNNMFRAPFRPRFVFRVAHFPHEGAASK